MKTKQIILLTLLLFLNVSILAQSIQNGVYSNENKFVCIKNDTILRYDGMFWYKGTFEIKNNKMYFLNNELLGKNTIIEDKHCGFDTIAFKLTTKTKHYIFGEPDYDTTVYDVESSLFTIAIGDSVFHAKKTIGVLITKEHLSQEQPTHRVWVYDEGSFSGFQDFLNIPCEFGKCYMIKQKYHDFRPSLISYDYNDSCIIHYDKKNGELLLNNDFSTDFQHPVLKYVSPNCDSCFNELKNRFPLLFE